MLNDTGFDIADDGSFEITVGGPPQDRGWLPLAPHASRLTVRHYWEGPEPPAAPPATDLGLAIDLVDGDVPAQPAAPTDESVASSIRRMATYVRSRTIDTMPRPGEGDPPAFVSRVPHEFPAPVPPGAHALAAADAVSLTRLGPTSANRRHLSSKTADNCRRNARHGQPRRTGGRHRARPLTAAAGTRVV